MAVLVGHLLVCVPAMLNGYVGCIYGVNFLWALVAAKGFGPTFSKSTHITDGTPVAVVFFQCVTTAIGPKATLALNMPDFTRYAKYPRQVFWTQGVSASSLRFVVS